MDAERVPCETCGSTVSTDLEQAIEGTKNTSQVLIIIAFNLTCRIAVPFLKFEKDCITS